MSNDTNPQGREQTGPGDARGPGEAAGLSEEDILRFVNEEAEATAQAASEAGDLSELLRQAQMRAEEHWNQLLALRAEMDNLRKRTEREVDNARKFALEGFLRDLLAVVDSLDMGLKAAQAGAANSQDPAVNTLVQGMDMTWQQMLQVLGRFGVSLSDPMGEKFDPALHQAVAMEPAESDEGRVLRVMQKGCLLNGRVVRPAMVVVSRPHVSVNESA